MRTSDDLVRISVNWLRSAVLKVGKWKGGLIQFKVGARVCVFGYIRIRTHCDKHYIQRFTFVITERRKMSALSKLSTLKQLGPVLTRQNILASQTNYVHHRAVFYLILIIPVATTQYVALRHLTDRRPGQQTSLSRFFRHFYCYYWAQSYTPTATTTAAQGSQGV